MILLIKIYICIIENIAKCFQIELFSDSVDKVMQRTIMTWVIRYLLGI